MDPGEPQSAMTMTKSTKVPKGWEELYAALTGLTDRFCEEYLDHEYEDLARHAIAALCRKRPSPLTSGNPQTWACAVLYALGQINFLSDKSTKPYMAMGVSRNRGDHAAFASCGSGLETGSNRCPSPEPRRPL
jgi:hypothetical protein